VASVAASRIDSWQSSWKLICRPPMAGRNCLDTAAYGHCCIGGIDQLGNDEQCLVSSGISVPVRSVFEPTLILASGATPAELLRWAAVLDLFGYSLATAVLAYVLWRQLRQRNPLIADLSTMAAVGYGLAGGLGRGRSCHCGADVDAQLHRCHGRRSGADRGPVRDCAAGGVRAIWQFLDAILLAAWWLGIGGLLRADRPRLSRLSLVLAASAIAGAAANVAGLSLVRDVLLGVLFMLWAAWWISLFVIYARQTNDFHHLPVVTEVRLPAGLIDRPALCGSLLDRRGSNRAQSATRKRASAKRGAKRPRHERLPRYMSATRFAVARAGRNPLIRERAVQPGATAAMTTTIAVALRDPALRHS
jgi:hypothetical protein